MGISRTMVLIGIIITACYLARSNMDARAKETHPNGAQSSEKPRLHAKALPSIQNVEKTACKLKSGPIKRVIKIVDAATMQLEDNTELRLADIFTPMALSSNNARVVNTPSVAEISAIQFLTTLVLGKAVHLKFFKSSRDRYGRRLSHPHVMTKGQNVWIQAELVKHGYALVAADRSDRNCVRQLLKLENYARKNARGYWGAHIFNVKKAYPAKELLNDLQTFQIVAGRVKRISAKNNTIYLNFSGNWKNDFTVSISRRVQKAMNWDLAKFTRLKGRYVRVRGWIDENYGPMIRLRQPFDLEHDLDKKIPGTNNRTGYPD